MKFTKYILAGLVLIISVVTVSVLTSVSQIAVMEADGHAVSASSTVKQSLIKGEDVIQPMTEVHVDDVIYSNALGYYVGANRIAIDRNYPILINGGETLKFLDESSILVSSDLTLLTTYNGLYLNDGHTYNENLTQADPDEFILLALKNGLYMSTQSTSFTNDLGRTEIPVGSIIRFSDSEVRFYRFEDGFLYYEEIQAVYNGKLTVGIHEYEYETLLKALSIISEKAAKPGKNVEKELEEIANNELTDREKEPEETELPEETEGAGTGDDEIVIPEEQQITEEEVFYLSEVADGERNGNGSGQDDIREVKNENQDIPSVSRDQKGSDDEDISDEDRTAEVSGGDIPGTDKNPDYYRKKEGKGTGTTGGAGKREYKKPEITMNSFESWAYAVKAHLNYSDPGLEVKSAVVIEVYDIKNPQGIPTEDKQGNRIYSRLLNDVDENDRLWKGSVSDSGDIFMSPFRPGSKVYVRYRYTYYTDISESVSAEYCSDFTEIELKNITESVIAAVKAEWTVERDDSSLYSAFGFRGLTLENTAGYDPEKEETFADFQKNTLPYISTIRITLQNLGDSTEEPVVTEIPGGLFGNAKSEPVDYTSTGILKPGTRYSYTVTGLDAYGNAFPLMVKTDETKKAVSSEEFVGNLFTWKTVPQVTLRYDKIMQTSVESTVSVIDSEQIFDKTINLKFCIFDSEDRKVKFSYQLDQEPEKKNVTTAEIPSDPSKEHNLVIKGLEKGGFYLVRIYGTYDPSLSGTAAQIVEDGLILSQDLTTARDASDYYIPTVQVEIEKPGKNTLDGSVTFLTDRKADAKKKTIIPSGVVVTVYEGLAENTLKDPVDPEGSLVLISDQKKNVYSWKDKVGVHPIERVSSLDERYGTEDPEYDSQTRKYIRKTEEMSTFGSLLADSTFYLQATYSYYILDGDGKTQKEIRVYSDLVEMHTEAGELKLDPILLDLTQVFAAGERSISFKHISLDEEVSGTADISALHSLLDSIEMTFTRVGDTGNKNIVLSMSSALIRDAIDSKNASYDSGLVKDLEPDSVYTYGVKAYRSNGDELVMKTTAHEEKTGDNTVGKVYTKKTVPSAKIRTSLNAGGDVTLEVYFADKNNALIAGNDLVFSLYEKKTDGTETRVELKGKIDGKNIASVTADTTKVPLLTVEEHILELTGLTVNQIYRISVEGSYDLTPTAGQFFKNKLPVEFGELVTEDQQSIRMAQRTVPAVTFSNIQEWYYAVGVDITIDDPSAAITKKGITVYVQDESGKQLMKRTVSGTQQFALYPLEPGSKAFIYGQYEYEYYDEAGTKLKKQVTTPKVAAQLLSLPKDGSGIPAIRGNWDELFAVSSSQAGFEHVKFLNPAVYDADLEEYSFDNFKNNILNYLSTVEVEFTPEGDGDRVKVTIESDTLEWAKLEEDDESAVVIKTKKGLLQSNRKYTYRVTAKDPFGNELPLRMSAGEGKYTPYKEFTGCIYTAKQAPQVTVTEDRNEIGDMELLIDVEDSDNSMIPELPFAFHVRDGQGKVKLNGVFYTISAKSADGYEYPVRMSTNSEEEEALVKGPDVWEEDTEEKERKEENKLPLPEITYREDRNEEEVDELFIHIKDTKLYMNQNRGVTFTFSFENKDGVPVTGTMVPYAIDKTNFGPTSVPMNGRNGYKFIINNLELGESYRAEVTGSYDPQPDAKHREEGADLDLVENEILAAKKFVASDGSIAEPGTATDPGEPEDSEGNSGNVYLLEPRVSMGELKSWAYAVGSSFSVYDPTSSIELGLRVYIATSIKGNQKYTTNINGQKVYSGEKNELVSSKRQSFDGSGDFEAILNGNTSLEPGKVYYFQYSYEYYKTEMKLKVESGTRKKKVSYETSAKQKFTSDITEVKTLTVEEADLASILGTWNENPAAYTNTFEFQKLHFGNTADYDPSPKTVTFENFKKNTVSYLKKVSYRLVELDAQEQETKNEITVTSANIVERAVSTLGGVTFTAETTDLKPNTHYRYRIEAIDDYGNLIPLDVKVGSVIQAVSYKTYRGTVYTRKAGPAIRFTEKEASSGVVNFDITVDDTDQSLIKDSLVLTVEDAAKGKKAKLGGTVNGEAIEEGVEEVALAYRDDGTYHVMINTLDFSTQYCLVVSCRFNPQPDFYPEGVVPLQPETLDERYQFGTQAMTYGQVYFNASTKDDDLKSNSAKVSLIMAKDTVSAVLDMISYYEISITDVKTGTKAATVTLNRDSDTAAGITGLADIPISGAVSEYLVYEEAGLKVYVTGTPRSDDENVWQAIRSKWNDAGEYQTPMMIRTEISGNRLASKTQYEVSVVSKVVRPNGKREVPTYVVNNTFTTKKKDPKLRYSEFYKVSTVAEMTGVYVEDEDGAINEKNGTVKATLVDMTLNGTKIAVEDVPFASGGKTVTPVDLVFKELVVGHEYLLSFMTDAYSNRVSNGGTESFLIAQFEIKPANDVGGDLNLENLDYDSRIAGKKSLRNISAEEAARRIEAKEDPFTSDTRNYQTDYIDLTLDVNGETIAVPGAITIDTPLPEAWTAWSYNYYQVYYYNSSKKEISSNYRQLTYKGGTTFVVPAGARYVRVFMYSGYSYAEHGIQLGYYESATRITYEDSADTHFVEAIRQRVQDTGSVTGYSIDSKTGLYKTNTTSWSALYKIPVTQGESYVIRNGSDGGSSYNSGTVSHFYYYDKNENLIQTVNTTARSNYLVTIPAKVAYMSVDYNGNFTDPWYSIYRIEGTGGSGDKYAASVRVQVNDEYGYLAKKSTAKALIVLEELDSILQPTEGTERSKVRRKEEVTLVQEGEAWTFDEYRIFDGLEGEKNWQVSLYVQCRVGDGEYVSIPLDVITFQTDAAYELIHNYMELKKVWQNPYGHFLVVNDFECTGSSVSMYLYGTIDFQGHVITAKQNVPLFEKIYPGGVLKNIVYSYPANTEATHRDTRPLVTYNYGTLDNVILRTEGEFWMYPEHYYNNGLLCYFNYGLISNFIFEMGGDLHMIRIPEMSRPNASIFMYVNYGIIENFYMFGKNNATLYVGVQEPEEGKANLDLTCSLIRLQRGIIRNGYTQFETVIYTPNITGTTNGWLFCNEYYSDNISNYYHVGDFTEIDKNGKSSTATKDRIFCSTANGTISNVWHLTKEEYTEMTARILYASPGNLQNFEWQKGLLNDAFDIEESLHVGYYPRLKLNDCMKKYQAYNPLPGMDAKPEYLSASMLSYTGQSATSRPDDWDYSSGLVRLYFNNRSQSRIKTITIAGLTVEGIQTQNMNLTTGQWEVDVKVRIDETNPNNAYKSKYEIISFTHEDGHDDVMKETDGFSFWKRIATPEDWYDITLHMDWNYRLTSDLDFGPLQYSSGQVQVRKGTDKFTGSVDGGGHTVSNISLNGVDYPSIFYRLYGGAVKNITFDNLNITSVTYPSDDYSGVIGCAERSVIDNVHVKNSSIEAAGNVGTVVGWLTTYSSMYNCSSVNNKMSDFETDKNTFYGGIVGRSSQSVIISSYSRDISISMQECTNIGGAGGIIGRCQGTTIQDGYATGTITGSAYNVGGIVGNFVETEHTHYESLWSRVTIDVTGDYVGGFAGRTSGTGTGILSLGDIFCIGTHVHRNIGYSRISEMKTTLTALNTQNVPGLTSANKDDCKYLLSAEDLTNWCTWADKVRLDENWDLKECWDEDAKCYQPLEYFPKVYKYPAEYDETTGKRVLVGDQAENSIYLPGKGGEQLLSISSGVFYKKGSQASPQYDAYVAQAEVSHPSSVRGGFDLQKFYEAVKKGRVYRDESFTQKVSPEEVINIIGMDMTGKDGAVVDVNITRDKQESPDASTILIANKGDISNPANPVYPFSMARDTYRLSLNYWLPDDVDESVQAARAALLDGTGKICIKDWKSANLMADITYTDDSTKLQKITYWEVGTYNKWVELIKQKNHGKTQENFMITAKIDFAGRFGTDDPSEDELFRNLQFGRLEGDKADCSHGLTNVVYETNSLGDPWIASVAYSMKNLLLENITGNLINSQMTKDRNRNAVIFATRDITNCYFHNIRTNVNNRTRASSGFILLCYGDLADNRIEGVYYDSSRVTSNYNYAAGFVCWTQGNVTNNTSSQINVQAPLASYVGGLFVSVNSSKMASQSPVSEVLVSGNHFYGGSVAVNGNQTDDTEDDIPARDDSYVCGQKYTGFVASYIRENATDNVIGRREDAFTVDSKIGAGGFAYYIDGYVLETTSDPGIQNNTVMNGSVISTDQSNGYTGGMAGYIYMYGQNVKGNTVNGMYVNGNGYTGGMFGCGDRASFYRNTVVNSNVYSGCELNHSKINALGTGGMFGRYVSYLCVRGSVIRNTKVTGPRNVGGVVGIEANEKNSVSYEISYSYVAEDVTVSATDPDTGNAGGLIGYSEKAYARYNAVGAAVNSAGNNAGGIVGKLNQVEGAFTLFQYSYFVGSVTGRDYVGGIIGYNRNYVPYTVKVDGKQVTRYAVVRFRTTGTSSYSDRTNRSTMNGITVAGTFTANGTTEDMDHPGEQRQHVSAWFNNQTDTASVGGDDARLQIWDQCVLNGKKIDTSEKKPLPQSKWISSGGFREKNNFTDVMAGNLGTKYFTYSEDLQVLKTYMPYVQYHEDDAQREGNVLPYAKYKVVGDTSETSVRGGIMLPDYGTNPDALTVYASGASTVNVEVSTHQDPEADPTPDHHLPDEYQEVLYITNDGKSYINTGYDGHDNDLMVDCKFTKVYSHGNYLFGQETIGGRPHNGLYTYNYLYYGYQPFSYAAPGNPNDIEMSQRKLDDGNVCITLNDTVKDVAIPENKSTMPMLIFACWNNSKQLRLHASAVRCHYFTLKKGDEIIRDLVPCYRKKDNVVGMYDLKTGEFLVNANTKGKFTAGPRIGSSYVPGGESGATEVYVLFGDVDKTKQTQGGTVYALTDGVASISYDFNTDISVSLDDNTANYTTYTPAELKRGIALNDRQDSDDRHIGDIWYYVGKDSAGNANLHYGLSTGTEPLLPEGYVRVEYIEASSAIKNQYIKTGVTGSQKVWYKIQFSNQKSERQLMGIYGSQDGYWGNRYGKYEGGGTVSSVEISDEPVEITWDYAIGGLHRLSVDDAVAVQKNATTDITGETRENQIFALSGGSLCSAKLYGCKIWKDGELVRWFVPVIKQVKDGGGKVTDSIPGLFDLMAPEGGKQFYENSYSTAVAKRFTAGPETEIPYVRTSVSGEISSDVTGLDGEPIHIWSETTVNGRVELHVLVDGNDGKVHEKTVTPMGAASEISFYVNEIGEVTSGTAETVQPFLKQRVTVTDDQTQAQVTYDVSNFYTYHALTSAGTTTKSEGRLYSDGLIRYNVSPWQNLLYDQVVVDDRGAAGDYIAVLSKDGTLTASFVCADLKTANVREISNSFTSYDPYIVVLYRDGSLKAADYETGEVIFTARNNAGFANYISDVIRSITESVSDGFSGENGSGAAGNGSGTSALLSHTKLTGRGLTVTTEVIPSGSTELSGTPEGETDGEDKEIEVENGRYEERKGETTETADAGTPGDDLHKSGDRGGSGETGNNSGESGGSGQEGSAEADGSREGDGDDAGNDDPAGNSGENGNGENADAPVASAVYVPGEGVKDLKGNTVAEESRVKYVAGEGVYVDGKLKYEESIFSGNQNAAEKAAGKAETGEEEQDDPEEKEKKESDGEDPEGEEEKNENPASEEKKNGNADGKGGAGQAGTHVSGENTGSEKKDETDGKQPSEADGSDKKSVPSGTDGDGITDGEGGASEDAAGGEGAPVLLVTGEEKQKQISAVFGESIKIMNTVTGEPEEYDTESVLRGSKMTVKEKKAREAYEKEQEEKEMLLAAEELSGEEAGDTASVKSDTKFVAAGGMNRILDKEEGSGMLLILFTGMIAVLVFGGVYITVIRRKREKLSLSGRAKETGSHREEDNR